MTGSVVAHIVTRNEADRYLHRCIQTLWDAEVIGVAVYDDRSTDDTTKIAAELGADVAVRPVDAPSFADDERAFRADGWRWMLQRWTPDWVLAIDADELLIGGAGGLRAATATVDYPTIDDRVAKELRIHEVWGFTPDGRPQVRVDGGWGTITGIRLVPGAGIDPTFPPRGSVPGQARVAATMDVSIAHLGYVRPEDRKTKYDRYRGHASHSARHVESIITEPRLVIRDDLRL